MESRLVDTPNNLLIAVNDLLERFKDITINSMSIEYERIKFKKELSGIIENQDSEVLKKVLTRSILSNLSKEITSKYELVYFIKEKRILTKDELSVFLKEAYIASDKLNTPDDFFTDELMKIGRIDLIKAVFVASENAETRARISHKYIIQSEMGKFNAIYGTDCMTIVYSYFHPVRISFILFNEAEKCLSSLLDDVPVKNVVDAIYELYKHPYTIDFIRDNIIKVLNVVSPLEMREEFQKIGISIK